MLINEQDGFDNVFGSSRGENKAFIHRQRLSELLVGSKATGTAFVSGIKLLHEDTQPVPKVTLYGPDNEVLWQSGDNFIGPVMIMSDIIEAMKPYGKDGDKDHYIFESAITDYTLTVYSPTFPVIFGVGNDHENAAVYPSSDDYNDIPAFIAQLIKDLNGETPASPRDLTWFNLR